LYFIDQNEWSEALMSQIIKKKKEKEKRNAPLSDDHIKWYFKKLLKIIKRKEND
jgi:hypothetical protein